MSSPDAPQPSNEERSHYFAQLYSQNQRRLRRYVLALLPNWTDADEVIAETGIRLWEQFEEYDSQKDFGSWACTIAHFQVLTRRNELARQGNILSAANLDQLADEAGKKTIASDGRMSALRYCLKKLSNAHRLLIEQVYTDDKRLAAIAQSVGHSTSAVAKRLSRIRIQLHKCIERRLSEEGQG